MTDHLSVSASILGILGFTAQVVKILNDYMGSARSALQEARTLRIEISAIQNVLEKLADFMENYIDDITDDFVDGCVLRSVIDECNGTVYRLCKQFAKLTHAKKPGRTVVDLLEHLKWPLRKEEYEKDIQNLRRLLQIFDFSINLSSLYVPLKPLYQALNILMNRITLH